MKREIKFRGWDAHHKVMITPYCELRDGNFWGEDTTNTGISVAHDNVMQFTGLKDKNGKDIYEGDVMQYKSYHAYKRCWSTTKEIPIIEAEFNDQKDKFTVEKEVVTFTDGGFRIGYSIDFRDVARGYKQHRGQHTSADFEAKQWDFEVIGNIYENPELLNP